MTYTSTATRLAQSLVLTAQINNQSKVSVGQLTCSGDHSTEVEVCPTRADSPPLHCLHSPKWSALRCSWSNRSCGSSRNQRSRNTVTPNTTMWFASQHESMSKFDVCADGQGKHKPHCKCKPCTVQSSGRIDASSLLIGKLYSSEKGEGQCGQ